MGRCPNKGVRKLALGPATNLFGPSLFVFEEFCEGNEIIVIKLRNLNWILTEPGVAIAEEAAVSTIHHRLDDVHQTVGTNFRLKIQNTRQYKRLQQNCCSLQKIKQRWTQNTMGKHVTVVMIMFSVGAKEVIFLQHPLVSCRRGAGICSKQPVSPALSPEISGKQQQK